MRRTTKGMNVTSLSSAIVAIAIFHHIAIAQGVTETRILNAAGSPYEIDNLVCAQHNIGTLIISGDVELTHPKDTNDLQPAPQITIDCSKIIYEPDSTIKTRAALKITARESMSGMVNITNTRSTKGQDGTIAEASVLEWINVPKPKMGKAQDGDNAKDGVRGAERGHDGPNGEEGFNGKEGVEGGHAKDATRAGRILLYAGTYMPGTEVNLTSTGGNGGDGTVGGTGQNGGKGGDAGDGGEGGNASWSSDGNVGGTGGTGGRGGNGGRGGKGGNAGNGANGGDLFAIVIVKDPLNPGQAPAVFFWSNEGGFSGIPGNGGAGGKFGDGGAPGQGGCGGQDKRFGPIVVRPGDRCGGQGQNGLRGQDGDPGKQGEWGNDGKEGEHGTNAVGYIPDPDASPTVDFSLSKVAFMRDPGTEDNVGPIQLAQGASK